MTYINASYRVMGYASTMWTSLQQRAERAAEALSCADRSFECARKARADLIMIKAKADRLLNAPIYPYEIDS